jgi:hypothetical protein
MLIHVEDGAKHLVNITPQVRQDDVTVDVTTITTSNIVTIGDTGSDATQYDAVYIPAHISVGGVILFGFYQAIPASANEFQIALYGSQGNPIFPTAAVSNVGAVAIFDTTAGDSIVTVTLPDHGYLAGDTYPVLISTAVGGVTLGGNYTVQSVIDADTFEILAQNEAVSTDTESINGGDARYDFYIGFGPLLEGTGYGIGGYGVGGYGSGITPAASSGDNIETGDWVLDNWGGLLIALPTSTPFGSIDGVAPTGGPLYFWSHADNSPTALAISGGPVASGGFFVAMPQRQIIAYNTEETGVQDPLLVRWCDVNNYQQWNARPTNLAGKYRLTRGSRIVGGMQIGQQGLLLTDVGAWTMRFIGTSGGSNLAYSFNEVARGCGLIAQKAMATLGAAAYWMGLNQFFVMGADGVQPVPCPIWDRVFPRLDMANLHKIRMGANSSFGEIWLFFPSNEGGGEIDSYVKYNTLIGAPNGWDYGDLSRTAWIDQSVLGQPIGADGESFRLQQHETGYNNDNQPMQSSFDTGYFVLQDGDVLAFVDQFWPDMRWAAGIATDQAQVQLTFLVKSYPNDTIHAYGPFDLTTSVTYVTPRVRGRLVSLRFESHDMDSFWRLGGNRYRWQPDGRFY